jgi:hypothetical protein
LTRSKGSKPPASRGSVPLCDESIAALAEEYGRTPQEIEEAIRWVRALPLPVAV